MSEQGVPARDTDDDTDFDTSGDVSEQNHEEKPEPGQGGEQRESDPDDAS